MAKADYIHKLKNIFGRDILVIEDLNLGNMSVTNDIENVVKDIQQLEHINPSERLIVYSDSEGCWDGWDHDKQEFVSLSEDSWYNAATKFIQIKTAAACR